jgi:hypothetical protein
MGRYVDVPKTHINEMIAEVPIAEYTIGKITQL